MRVLIGADTWTPNVNGACYAARRLAAGLADRGHDVHVAAPATGFRSRPAERVGPITEHRVRSMPVPRPTGFRICPPPGLHRTCRALLRRVRPDVVHVQSHMILGRMLLSAARELGIPAIATTHMVPDNILPAISFLHLPTGGLKRLFWWDAARVLDRAGVVTAPTPHAAMLAETHGVPGPVLPVSNGLDTSRFHPDDGDRGPAFRARHGIPDGPLVGVVGRLDHEKHVDEIIRSLSIVRRSIPDARLLVVGDGNEHGRLLATVRAEGLERAVTFTGRLPDDELADVYAAIDVFVNAGTAELQSLVTLEAMATARPVVAVDAGALPHLVRHGENGFRYPHGDVATLAARVVQVLADADGAARMGEAGLRIVAEHTMPATLDAFESLYRAQRAAMVPDTRRTADRPGLTRTGRGR